MANIQKENGYTIIANEILEVLAKIPLSSGSRRILDVIFRKTYGFHKKIDRISLTQFEIATGLCRTNVCRSINKLKDMKIIIVIPTEDGNTYTFQKNHDEWIVDKIPLGSGDLTSGGIATGGSGVNVKRVVAEMPHTKESITKETIKRNIYTKNFKTTYKTKDKIFKQLGIQYKPNKKTSAQEKAITAMLVLDYYRDRVMELHRASYLTRPEDKNKTMIKKVIDCLDRFETKEKCKELVDWFLDGYGEWAKYEPTACFMSKTYQSFENKDIDVKKKGGVYKL
jgi:phage replication O-like protein O